MGTSDERTGADAAAVTPLEELRLEAEVERREFEEGSGTTKYMRGDKDRTTRTATEVIQADEVKISTHEDEIRKKRQENLKKARAKRAANLAAKKEREVSAVSEPVREPVVRECMAKRRGSTMMHPMWVLVFEKKREWASDMTLTRRPEDGVAIGQGMARLLGLEHGDRVKVTIEKVEA